MVQGMFVYYYTYLPRGFPEVASLIDDRPEVLLGATSPQDHHQGATLRLTLHIDKGLPLSKEVLVRTGEWQRFPDHAVLPFTAEAAGATGFFPHLEGEFEAAPVTGELTQLTLRGSYRPPLGKVGGLVDKALLGRFAEAAIKDLVDQLAYRATAAS